MMKIRRTQTQVKHEILARYLDTWGGIIVNGLRYARHQRIWKFIYVDCFAFKGKYKDNEENSLQNNDVSKPVYGSPIIGIQALDKLEDYASKIGIKIERNIVLIEKNKANFRDLKSTLQECGYEKRIKETVDFSTLQNGEIALINKDSTQMVEKLTNFTNREGVWAFYMIDPWGPSGIPFDFVKMIVNGDQHDVMINFVYIDLIRKVGMAQNDDLPPTQRKLVDHWRMAYGGARWDQTIINTVKDIRDYRFWGDKLGKIPINDIDQTGVMTDDQLIDAKERVFVTAYQDTLSTMDHNIAIKLIALKFPDKERTMFYLFLTTHDPTGALALNEILNDAKYLEYELRCRLNTIRSTPPGQLSFWEPGQNIPKPKTSARPSTETVGEEIFKRFQGQIITRKEVYFSLVDTVFYPKEINNAIKLLKGQGKVLAEGEKLSHKTRLCFTGESKG